MYQDITDQEKITKQIKKYLQVEQDALDVMNFIATKSAETKPKGPDYIGQWLGILAESKIDANRINGGDGFIEIRPSGTTGLGKSDRMLLQVTSTTVEIVKASEATH